MWVTAYNDASYTKYQKRGAWAIYLKSDLGIFQTSGICPAYCTDPTMCEVFASGMAIAYAKATWSNSNKINIVSDCDCVIKRISHYDEAVTAKSNNHKELDRLILRIVNHLREHKWIVTTKHVPAHRDKTGEELEDRRIYLNDTVDGLAKKTLQEFLKKKKHAGYKKDFQKKRKR